MEILQIHIGMADTPQQLVEIMDGLEANFEVNYDNQIANLQLFSYILVWDIVNARFLYYKYKHMFDNDHIGREQVKFIKCVFENKHFEIQKACGYLCDTLSISPIFKKWLGALKEQVNIQLKKYLEANFQSISAQHMMALGFNPQGQGYCKITEQPEKTEAIDIEKLTKMARMIQNMNNK